jgi:hypothetical protein
VRARLSLRTTKRWAKNVVEQVAGERWAQLREQWSQKPLTPAQVELCRTDPNAFIELVFTDEDGAPYRQAAHHREWQQLFSTSPRLSLLGHAESGKTQQVALRLVWELGRNPEMRCYIVSAAAMAAEKIVGVVKRSIDDNPKVRQVFPALRPGKPWNNAALLVAGRKASTTKDFSLQAYGWNAKFLGIRADLLIADDINDSDNSRTPEARAHVIKVFDEKLQTRATKRGRVWAIGNAWHQEDLVHTLGARKSFDFRRYAVLGDDGATVQWPDQFPLSRIRFLRGSMPELSFARAYMCLPYGDETARFERSWFSQAKRAGMGLEYAPKAFPVDPITKRPWYIYIGIDLASGRRGRGQRKADSTAIFALAYHPVKKLRRILEIQSGQWKAPEIVARMQALHAKWEDCPGGGPVFAVEDDATQKLFVDSNDLVGLRVIGITTGGRKWDPVLGIEQMALTLHAQRWQIPSSATVLDADGDPLVHDALASWQHDMESFSPVEHTPDAMIAGWIADSAAQMFSHKYFAITPRLAR